MQWLPLERRGLGGGGSSHCLSRCGATLRLDLCLIPVVQTALQRENLYSPITEHTLLSDGRLSGWTAVRGLSNLPGSTPVELLNSPCRSLNLLIPPIRVRLTQAPAVRCGSEEIPCPPPCWGVTPVAGGTLSNRVGEKDLWQVSRVCSRESHCIPQVS